MNKFEVEDLTVEFLDESVANKIRLLSQKLLNKNEFLEIIWPSAELNKVHGSDKEIKVKLVLLPLQRVGAPEGGSGAKVMVAYFNDASNLWCSKPMVIKYGEKDDKGKDKLKNEQDNFKKIRPYAIEFKDSFAAPIFLSKDNKFRVLWSPFLSSVFSVDDRSKGLKLEENDLWKFLTDEVKIEDSEETFRYHQQYVSVLLDATYDYLRPVHEKMGLERVEAKENIDYYYNRYTRKYNDWVSKWESVWGDKSQINWGSDKINPIYVFEELLKSSHNIRLGAVHGDLHPKNILVDHFKRPQIIDFGWSEDTAHILVDFALMEANLRFVTLRNPLPERQLNLLVKSINTKDLEIAEMTNSPYLHFIKTSILNLRMKARKLYDSEDEFEREYVLSLFLICFGLLKFIESYKNQFAARLTVEALAKRAHELFLK